MNENQVSSRRQFWTGFLIAFCLLALPLLGLEYYIQHRYLNYLPGGLADLKPKKIEDKIWLGNDLFAKKSFLADSRVSEITDMKLLKLSGNAAVKLGIAGQSGAIFTDRLGNSLKAVSFIKTRYSGVDLFPSAKKGTCQFRVRGSWSVPAALLDENGKELWSYGGSKGLAPDDSAAGDLDGNGEMEFAVGFNGGTGIHLLDSKGKKIWEKKDANVWHVEMADVSGHGPLQIVHSNAAGKLIVRDKDGNVLSEKKPEPYFSHFSLVHWPSQSSRSWPVVQDNELLWILNFEGGSLAKYYLPKATKYAEVVAVPFMLRGDKQPGLAALVYGSYLSSGSNLYFYAADGRLLYHESSSEIWRSLLALPRVDGAEDTLLVGGNGRVWQYAVQAAVDAQKLKSAGISGSDFIGVDALAKEGSRLHATGKWAEAEKALRKVLAIREKAGKEGEDALAAPLVTLANWCSDTAHYAEGDQLYLRAEKILEKVDGPDSQDLAGCLNYHATMLKKAGNWDGVELIWKRVQKIRENNPKLEIPSAKDLERELKEASARKASNKDAAKVTGRENKMSEAVAPEADRLAEEGIRLHAAGKFDEAEKVLRKALAIRESAGGKDDASLAAALGALANWCSDTAHYSEGDKLYLRVEGIIEKIHGSDSQELASCLSYHATMLKKAGNWDGVELIWKRIQKIREINPKIEDPSAQDLAQELKEISARKAGNTGAIEPEQGKKGMLGWLKADTWKDRLTRIWEWLKALFDFKTSETDSTKAEALEADRLAGVGSRLHAEKKFDEAEKVLRKVLEIREKAGVEDEAALAAAVGALANWCSDTAHYSEGESLYLRAEKILEKIHGTTSPELVSCLISHATMLKKTGNWDGVELIWKRLQKIREINQKLEIISTIDVMRELDDAAEKKASQRRVIEPEQGKKGSWLKSDGLMEKFAGIFKRFKGAAKVAGRKEESPASIAVKDFEADPAKAEVLEAQWFEAGKHLNEEEANVLREVLKKDENDLESRFKFFGYLDGSAPRYTTAEGMAEFAGQYFWIAEHLPRSTVFSRPLLYNFGGDGFEKSLEVWGILAAKNPDDAQILGNAAHQYYRKMEQAIVYYFMAKNADPNNPRRYFDWGRYVLACVNDGERNDIDRDRAKAAMHLFQEGMLKPGAESIPFKEHLCWAAWKADDFDAAKKYAKIALDSSGNTVQTPTDQKSGLLYAGNSVLGLLDLRRGDIKSSINHMIASAISKSGYVPNSFGMDFELARSLFDKGEKDAVINFLNETATFRGNYNAPKWIELIKAGKKPDFKRF